MWDHYCDEQKGFIEMKVGEECSWCGRTEN